MADDDLEVLAPEQTVTVAGEPVTVRELTFGETLRHAREVGALTTALRDVFRPGVDRAAQVALIDATMTRHPDAVLALVAAATGREPAWIEALPSAEGELLVWAWWQVHLGFFVRRLAPAVLHQQAGASAGSSPPSPATGTTPSA